MAATTGRGSAYAKATVGWVPFTDSEWGQARMS
jgi:hypothetical protein